MSLLSQASLVVVPSGYKEDVVYSVKPTDGSGDLTFTRASDGTRVNSQGLVERVPWNFVTYSEDFGNAAWTKTAVAVGSSTSPNPVNGLLTAKDIVPSVALSSHRIFQLINGLPSQQNTWSVYAKANGYNFITIVENGNTGANVSFNLSSGTIGQQNSATGQIEALGNGWYRCSMIHTTLTTPRFDIYVSPTDSISAYAGDGTSGVILFGAQTVIGSTAKPYFPTTDRLNVPRLDYSNGCPSLLLEPQRTNLVTYSEQFDNAAWSKLNSGSGSTTPIVTANYAISPDGTQNADRLQCTLGSSGYSLINQGFGASGTHTGSIWVKSNTGANQNVYFRVSNNTTAYVVTTEWQRITLTESNGDYLTIGLRDLTGYINYSCDILIWGAQLEAGSYPTSYIGPTTSASVTRVADAASKTGISSLIGQTEGTLFVEVDLLDYVNTDLSRLMSLGTVNDRIVLLLGTNARPRAFVNVGGSIQVNSTATVSLINGLNKVAFAYKQNDFVIYLNGVSVLTDTSGTVPTCSNLYVGTSELSISDDVLKGRVSQAVLFKTRISNTNLASLTTL